MKTFISILIFIMIGVGGGLLLSHLYKTSSILANIIGGISGSLGVSWLASRLGVGGGFSSLTLPGLLFGVAGALLTPLIVCLIHHRSKDTQ